MSAASKDFQGDPTVDHYAALGLTSTASSDEIRNAYRAIARTTHPDYTPDLTAHARFRSAAAAYAILRDADLRASYDAHRRSWQVFGARHPAHRPGLTREEAQQIQAILAQIQAIQPGRAWQPFSPPPESLTEYLNSSEIAGGVLILAILVIGVVLLVAWCA